jgi:hypothetical protein
MDSNAEARVLTARSSPSSLHFRVEKGAPDGISLRDEMTVRLGDDFSARRLPDATV